ncbi:hypothetical protein [Pengzhenrongella sp.]|uniref:hypothetical protein n=1 Tax=Pengzhenrongella sp. TaxID=2888820 RepID=UPI002F94343F
MPLSRALRPARLHPDAHQHRRGKRGHSDVHPYGTRTTTGATSPFGFAGQYTETETGFLWMRAR